MPILKNAKHELFCQNVAKGMSQDAAYKAAFPTSLDDDSRRGNASTLRAKKIIAARIEELVGKGAEKALVEIADVIKGLLNISKADLADAFEEDGKTLKNIHKIPKRLRLALAGIDIEEIREDGAFIGYAKKIKLNSREKALENLGRYLKIFTDKVEHSGKVTLEDLVAGPGEEEK